MTFILITWLLTEAIEQNFDRRWLCVPQILCVMLCYWSQGNIHRDKRKLYVKAFQEHLANWAHEKEGGVNSMFRERVPPIGVCCTRLAFRCYLVWKINKLGKTLINQCNVYTILFLLPNLTLTYKLVCVMETHFVAEGILWPLSSLTGSHPILARVAFGGLILWGGFWLTPTSSYSVLISPSKNVLSYLIPCNKSLFV